MTSQQSHDFLEPAGTDHARSQWLLTRLGEGECDALAELYDRYCRLVYSIALRILRDQGEAEDMVQDVFLTIYRNANTKVEGKGTVCGWIVSIAYHRSLDRWRYLCSRHYYKENGLEVLRRPQAEQAPDYAEILNVQRRVQSAMTLLLPRQEQTLRLYFYEGYSLREIAEQTGESFRNVRNHFYRGIARMRTVIATDQDTVRPETVQHSPVEDHAIDNHTGSRLKQGRF